MTGSVSEMDRAVFLEHFGGVYEHSPWIAEQVFDTGLGPLTDLSLIHISSPRDAHESRMPSSA